MGYIELKNVSFKYSNGFTAVDGISLSIEKGENIAIVGQNGAGKTTTVKLLNALHYPTNGDVFIGDMNTKEYTTAQVSRVVGYVFQNPNDQIFHSTVKEEVEYGPKMMKLPEEEIRRRVEYALRITNLTEWHNRNPFDIPLAMRKFVTIASIIAMECEVIVFDEPTAGQDLNGNKLLESIFNELLSEGKTLITITHDMVFVAENFNRVLVMANKKIIAEGTPREVFYNRAVMDKAMLKAPYISRVFDMLGLPERVTQIEEAIDVLMSRRLNT